MNQTLGIDELKRLTGYERPGDVERCLRGQGVPLLRGRNGVFTTLRALEQAIGVRQDPEETPKIEF